MTIAPPKVVGLMPNPERAEAHELARRVATHLAGAGVEVRLPVDDASVVGLARLGREEPSFLEGLDVVVSLGGDGTMLYAIDATYEREIPVLGVNVGRLGYLAEVEAGAVDDALDRLVDGRFTVTERMVLSVVATIGGAERRISALNECTLEKVHPGHTVRLDVAINGRPFTTYTADGVIVATPTGSTAYSFSARGPIVSPAHRCMLLTPVSPHMLFDRSLVLGPTEQLRFEVSGEQPVHLTSDGRETSVLKPGDTVVCTGGERAARIVTFEPRDFHQILKAKFGLADR